MKRKLSTACTAKSVVSLAIKTLLAKISKRLTPGLVALYSGTYDATLSADGASSHMKILQDLTTAKSEAELIFEWFQISHREPKDIGSEGSVLASFAVVAKIFQS